MIAAILIYLLGALLVALDDEYGSPDRLTAGMALIWPLLTLYLLYEGLRTETRKK